MNPKALRQGLAASALLAGLLVVILPDLEAGLLAFSWFAVSLALLLLFPD